MPLNIGTAQIRERYPLHFELEGIPRAEFNQALKELQMRTVQQVHNTFAADGVQVSEPFITDINNPPAKRYIHQDFPCMLYAEGKKARVVNDAKERDKAIKDGWSLKPISDVPEKTELDRYAALVTRPKQDDLVLSALAQRFQ
jgi:hypothetical protein